MTETDRLKMTPALLGKKGSRRHSLRNTAINFNNPGTWAFHWHILPRAESGHRIFGMVTAVIVN